MDEEHFRVTDIRNIADLIIRIVTARAEEDKQAGAFIAETKQEETKPEVKNAEESKRPEAKKGLATLCIGGGMGCATIVEKYE